MKFPTNTDLKKDVFKVLILKFPKVQRYTSKRALMDAGNLFNALELKPQ